MVENLALIEKTFRGTRQPEYMNRKCSTESLPAIQRTMSDFKLAKRNSLHPTDLLVIKQESYSNEKANCLNSDKLLM